MPVSAGLKAPECKGPLMKKIYEKKDVIHFIQQSPASSLIEAYVDLLCGRIVGTGNKILNHKYVLKNETFIKCSAMISRLEECCDATDITPAQSAKTLRFGHVAFRDWFEKMKDYCKELIDEITIKNNDQYKQELLKYLTESFGNPMRIDYGTGHELNFLIFTMGLSNLVESPSDGDVSDLLITSAKLEKFIQNHGWDVLCIFAHRYLRLCRRIQTKFRLEPAGSRGVFNMDDFQFLPFLFGAAQIAHGPSAKLINSGTFHLGDQIEEYKNDFIFFEAIDFIWNNKRGPFHEHSYTLWNLTELGSWENILRRIRTKFTGDILNPFPIVQHLLFGQYILRWE